MKISRYQDKNFKMTEPKMKWLTNRIYEGAKTNLVDEKRGNFTKVRREGVVEE